MNKILLLFIIILFLVLYIGGGDITKSNSLKGGGGIPRPSSLKGGGLKRPEKLNHKIKDSTDINHKNCFYSSKKKKLILTTTRDGIVLK